MTIRRKGLIRLWIVLSVIWTVGFSMYQFKTWSDEWAAIDRLAYQNCFSQDGLNAGQTTDQCLDAAGVRKNYFERDHTTAGAWWSEMLGISFVIDLVVTALAIGAFFVLRWVLRGFRNDEA